MNFIFQKSPFYLLVLFIFVILYPIKAQKVKITRIIDTNLFEINEQDTIKLANVDIPSKSTSDSLLKNNFIPYVIKYDRNKLLRNYFVMEYADSSDSLSPVRSVYLYEKHPLSKDLVNYEFLLKGYGKYIPLKDSEAQRKCEKAGEKAKRGKKGIWNEGMYFHVDLGMREAVINFGYGKTGEDKTYTKYMVSFQNEQNRVFSAKIEISYYQRVFMDYEGEFYPPQKKTGNDLLINAEVNGNSDYMGLKFMLRLYYSNLDSETNFTLIPFLPGIGVNLGKIKTAYASFTLFPTSYNRLYVMSLSAHYFLPMPFWSIHFFYYFSPKNINNNREFRLKLAFSVNDKFSFNFDASNIGINEGAPIKNYYSLSMGIGWLFR